MLVCVHVPSSAVRMSVCVCTSHLQRVTLFHGKNTSAHGKNRPQKCVEEAEACGALEVPMGVGYMFMFVQGVACRQNILVSA